VRSPSGELDAVVYEINGGATTSFAYEVYVTAANRSTFWGWRTAKLYGALRNRSAYGVNLVWTGTESLRIRYLETRSAELASGGPFRVAGRSVVVGLEEGVHDPKACPGGMLYDFQMSNIRGPDCGIRSH
jgi:hypothetical protein